MNPNKFFAQNDIRFTKEIQSVDWGFIKNIGDAQTAYSMPHYLLVEKYKPCSPLKNITKDNYSKSNGLGQHFIKTSCMLTGTKAINSVERYSRYKIYQNKLYHLLCAAT